MKIFILAPPHTQTTLTYSTCAFTQKTYYLCKILYEMGFEVIHLGTEGSNPPCTENINVVSEKLYLSEFKKPDSNFYKTETSNGIYKDTWITNTYNEILKRCDNGDYKNIICHSWGGLQQIATEKLKQFRIESGIGYPNTFAPYRVFESYAWMHFHHGLENRRDGNRWYDVVIPQGFDSDLFPVNSDKNNYVLFMGRLNDDKGVQIAVDVTKATGNKLIIIGQGNPERFLKNNPHVSYLPPVGHDQRNILMSKAKAFICPTIYTEPLGFVAIEAQLCGTPVITTDWGGFTETVQHGVTGYRCRTFDQFCWALRNIHMIKPSACRQWSESQFSLKRMGLQYQEYFQMITDLDKNGWYENHSERDNLNWLNGF